MNALILKVSRDARTTKEVSRGTAPYNLKYSKNIRVAYGEQVRKLLYSKKYEEHHAFCESFFLEFPQNSGGKVKPGSIAEAFRKRVGLVWKHYWWATGETEHVVK